MADLNLAFAGSIPEVYHRHLGPVLFAPYAADLARRVASAVRDGTVLEVACGTGIVTGRLRDLLPADVGLVATDLSQAMVAFARAHETSGGIDWRTADATALPFDDGSMAAVVCQFGLMFVPDKPRALREARRVLRPGGRLWFSVWDSLMANPPADAASRAVMALMQPDPPPFFQVPHGLHDVDALRQLLEENGFTLAEVAPVSCDAVAESAESFATGFVRGTPLSVALAERGADHAAIILAVAQALREIGGDRPFRSTTRAWVLSAAAGPAR